MKYIWQDLPERKNLFTVKNTTMINLNTGEIVRHYATNTKIAVVQKCVTPDKTYYRTQDAVHNYLNYAFEAEAFGLPNEKAPSAPFVKSNPEKKSATRTRPTEKTNIYATFVSSKGGEGKTHIGWLKRLFRRKNG